MLGFDAIAALPIADDKLSDEEAQRIAVAAVIGGNRINAAHDGGQLISAGTRGGTRIQTGAN